VRKAVQMNMSNLAETAIRAELDARIAGSIT
jgi:post-segregation antitoxin (ccd killing protein)